MQKISIEQVYFIHPYGLHSSLCSPETNKHAGKSMDSEHPVGQCHALQEQIGARVWLMFPVLIWLFWQLQDWKIPTIYLSALITTEYITVLSFIDLTFIRIICLDFL